MSELEFDGSQAICHIAGVKCDSFVARNFITAALRHRHNMPAAEYLAGLVVSYREPVYTRLIFKERLDDADYGIADKVVRRWGALPMARDGKKAVCEDALIASDAAVMWLVTGNGVFLAEGTAVGPRVVLSLPKLAKGVQYRFYVFRHQAGWQSGYIDIDASMT